jgi:VanZ family protein
MAEWHRRRNWFVLLLGLCCIWIFANSLFDGGISSALSGHVLYLLQKAFSRLGGNPDILTMHRIRKVAHFLQYAMLGMLLFLSNPKSGKRWLYPPLFWGLTIALLDECLQLLVPGRAGMVQDVLLDFSGVIFGIGAGYLLQLLWRYFNQDHSQSYSQGQGDE